MTTSDQNQTGQIRRARIILASLLALFGLWIVSGFLAALVWALIIAIAIDPLHMRLRRNWPGRTGRTLLAVAITLTIGLVVLVPLALGLTQLAGETQAIAAWISTARENGVPAPAWLGSMPVAGAMMVRWWQSNLGTPEAAALQLHHLAQADLVTHTRLIGSNVLHRGVIFTFTLLTLFFLLRDRDTVLAQCARAGERLLGPAGERIAGQAILSVRGTIDGLVLVGLGEGAVMVPVYLLTGVPHPIMLGTVTAVAAMIPFGAALVFAVAALLLLVQGSVGGALAIVLIGFSVVGVADHFVRPALIGGATRLPFVAVLIGILGGVETLGLLGLFIGPATIAVLILLWREFVEGVGTPSNESV